MDSLSVFIKTNIYLIEALGVFGALCGIFTSLNIPYLSFIALLMLILVLFELYRVLKTDGEFKFGTALFNALLWMFVLYLFCYIIAVYKNHIKIFAFAFFILLYIYILIILGRKFEPYIRTKIEDIKSKNIENCFYQHRNLMRFIIKVVLINGKIPIKVLTIFFVGVGIILFLVLLIQLSAISSSFFNGILENIEYDKINNTFIAYNNTIMKL
jgi:hypothetical protein